MEIGVPKETKDQEFRVGLSPSSVRVLRENDHAIFVQTQAGTGAGFTDDEYISAGAEIVPTPEAVWNRELVVKVKEPLVTEYKFLQKSRYYLLIYIWQPIAN